MEPAAKNTALPISIGPASPEQNCKDNTDSPSLFNRIKKCFNCLKQPKTLLAIGGVLLGVGAISTGLAFAPPMLALSPILLPLGVVLMVSGVSLSAIGLAMMAYTNAKNKTPSQEISSSHLPSTAKTVVPQEAIDLLNKSAEKMQEFKENAAAIHEKAKNRNLDLSTLQQLQKQSEENLSKAREYTTVINQINEPYQACEETEKTVFDCQASFQSIEQRHKKIQNIFNRTQKAESSTQTKEEKIKAYLTLLIQLERISHYTMRAAQQALDDAKNSLISAKEAVIICQKALSKQKSFYKRASIQDKYLGYPTRDSDAYIILICRYEARTAEALKQAELALSSSASLFETCFEPDLSSRFMGLPLIIKLSLDELKIKYVPQAEFAQKQKNHPAVDASLFAVNKDALSAELQPLDSNKLSNLFYLVKHYLPKNPALYLEKAHFFAHLLQLLGYQPQLVSFDPSSQPAESKYFIQKKSNYSCCLLSVQGKSYIMDFDYNDILDFDIYEDNQPDDFDIETQTFASFMQSNRETPASLMAKLRTALEEELEQ